MTCTVCQGSGVSTARPDGLCPQCLGTGYYSTDDYCERHEQRKVRAAALRVTYGKNGAPTLPAVKG